MNERKKLTTLFREVINLIIKFFKPYGLRDELLEIPESIKNMGFKVGCMNWIMTVISLAFAFLLKLTNMACGIPFGNNKSTENRHCCRKSVGRLILLSILIR